MQLGLGAFSVYAQDVLIDSPVYSVMDIYRAGGYNDGSDGIAPAVYAFPAKEGQTLMFSSVTEGGYVPLVNFQMARTGHFRAAATVGWVQFWVNPVGPFSGYETANFAQATVGVFLEDPFPAIAATSAHSKARTLLR